MKNNHEITENIYQNNTEELLKKYAEILKETSENSDKLKEIMQYESAGKSFLTGKNDAGEDTPKLPEEMIQKISVSGNVQEAALGYAVMQSNIGNTLNEIKQSEEIRMRMAASDAGLQQAINDMIYAVSQSVLDSFVQNERIKNQPAITALYNEMAKEYADYPAVEKETALADIRYELAGAASASEEELHLIAERNQKLEKYFNLISQNSKIEPEEIPELLKEGYQVVQDDYLVKAGKPFIDAEEGVLTKDGSISFEVHFDENAEMRAYYPFAEAVYGIDRKDIYELDNSKGGLKLQANLSENNMKLFLNNEAVVNDMSGGINLELEQYLHDTFRTQIEEQTGKSFSEFMEQKIQKSDFTKE